MATELPGHQRFYKILQFQSKLSCFCKQKYAQCIHILASPHLFNKNEKLKIMQLFKYRLPWQPNHQIVNDFTKRAYSRQYIFLKQSFKLIIYAHIIRNQHQIINIKIKFTNELSQFMLPWQPKQHTIIDFTNMAYSTKRAYSKQIISFQHDRI